MRPSFNHQDSLEKNAEKRAFAQYIGKRLRTAREQKGISQEILSEKAGYYRTYVGHIENGRYSPSLHTMWRLAHAMGVDLGDFLKGL